jgi:ComF family protein
MPDLTQLRQRLSALVFPPHCTVCGVLLSRHDPNFSSRIHFCELCQNQVIAPLHDACRRCGAIHPGSRVGESSKLECRFCRRQDFPVEACSALGNYGDLLQRLVIQLKGHRNESLALQLGQLLGQRLKELPWSRNLEAIVPVPAHWSKQLQKGFHGAAVIGEGIRRELRLDWLPRAVRSTRRTAKQGMLENSERFRNVAGAFEVTTPDRVAGRNLLIVDDVLTSGATMTAVCETLQEADAGQIYAAVLARGIRSAS